MPYLGVKPADEFTSKDLNGEQLILDADADTTITADTDDQIDIRIAGADDFQFTANTFTAQSGSTIAAQALTATTGGFTGEVTATGFTGTLDGVLGSGTPAAVSATTIGSSGGVTITGTTPTLTIGDAGAEDTKIVFDGNAQDFHIGLDDTDDDLKIGLGSAVGTTTHMVFNEAGEITKPLQPTFIVAPNGVQNNIAINTAVTLIFDNEIKDTGANFAANTFTAPVTGKYQINVIAYFATLQIDSDYYNLRLVTSNRTYYSIFNSSGFDAIGYHAIVLGALADMDAGDTALVKIFMPNGTAAADLQVASHFSGFLVA